MKMTYDQEADALYLRLNEKTIAKTLPLVGYTLMLDVDEAGKPVGIEILGASQHISDPHNIHLEDITRLASESS
jgi:uncharacterized protein YuzE